jgi:hypothetical protein
MAGTYSKYDNTNWSSTSSFLVLSDSGTQSYAFNNAYLGNNLYTNLIDNENRLLQPKYLRNSILSLWDLPTFKLTTSGSNIKYIGVDSGSPGFILASSSNILFTTVQLGLPVNERTFSAIFAAGTNDGSLSIYATSSGVSDYNWLDSINVGDHLKITSFTQNNIYSILMINSKSYSTGTFPFFSFGFTTINSNLTLTSNTKFYISYNNNSSSNINDPIKDKKILFGKRSYKESETVKDLLSTDTDIFFYNTKADNDLQYQTKITFLSGQNPNIYQPSIISKYVQGRTASLYMDIINNDNIEILSRSYTIKGTLMSDNNLGSTVSVNNIVFPTYGTNSTSSGNFINGKYLMLKNGVMTWTSSVISSSSLGTVGSELNIYGSKTTLNGYELDFTDSRMTPYDLGGIVTGSTFSKDSLTEVLNRIIYNNTPPKCSLTMLGNVYHEVGTSPDIILQYKIQKFNNPIKPTKLINMIPSQLAPISDEQSVVIEGKSEAVFITPIIATTSHFTIKVEDIYGGINTITRSITGVYPYYYGFSTYSVPDIFELEKFTKLIEDKGNKTIDVWGEGNLFFIYDKNYGPLNSIATHDGKSITTFNQITATFSSPNGFWDSKEFYIYRRNSVQIDLPSRKYIFRY